VDGGRRIYYELQQPRPGLRAMVTGTGRAPAILSPFIELTTERGVSREEVEELVRPFGLHVHYQDRGASYIFVLESDEPPGLDFGALPERLMALPGVRSARSILDARSEELASVVATDALFPVQFHAHVIRLLEAWEELPAIDPGHYGSADVIVAVHDSGIVTTGNGSAINHPEFQGNVTGGKLSGPVVSARKVLFTYDFQPVVAGDIRPGNDKQRLDDAGNQSPHGSWTTGVIGANKDVHGIAGIAPNVRLCSYIAHFGSTTPRIPHALDFVGGFQPSWQNELDYSKGQSFPAPFGTARNVAPAAHIINCSHTLPVLPPTMDRVLQRLSLFGRDRRGVLVFAAAGNMNRNCRKDGCWGEDLNVMRVSASALDVDEEEVRMNYSNFSAPKDRIIDFCAPSESHNVPPVEHLPPLDYGFITTDRDIFNGLHGGFGPKANVVAAVQKTLQIAQNDLSSFAAGQQVLIRDKDKPLHAELRKIATVTKPVTIELDKPLNYSYAANRAEIIRLDGTGGYSIAFGGTSAATPQASAIAALILSLRPELTWLEVRQVMRDSAVPINLRYRGPAYLGDPNRERYAWQHWSGATLFDANGLLATGSCTTTKHPYSPGDRFIKVADSTDIHARQSLLIGAETTLADDHGTESTLRVADERGFKKHDEVYIGRSVRTVLISDCGKGRSTLWVQSEVGFEIGDVVTVDPNGPKPEDVTIEKIARMSLALGAEKPPNGKDDDAECGLTLTAPLKEEHKRYAVVEISKSQREGPFKLDDVQKGKLVLEKAVAASRKKGTVVRKKGTELRAVVAVDGKQVEIDPLRNDHDDNENVGIGLAVNYSPIFGYGRLDALAAIRKAVEYSHDDRDLMIRNFVGDDGVKGRAKKEVDSPDVWVHDDVPDDEPEDSPKHDAPRVTIDPPIHVGVGKNDAEVSGTCTSAAELTFTLKIASTGTPDKFDWSVDGGPVTAGVSITGFVQSLSNGVSVQFASTTGHTAGDRWIIAARKIGDRYLHVRVRNRGKETSFGRSSYFENPTLLDVAQSRILLCVADGFPVCRFASTLKMPGFDNLSVVSRYTGKNERALYSVEISAVDPGGDTFTWYRDGNEKGTVKLAVGSVEHALDDGVKIRFLFHNGHQKTDRWDLFARSGEAAFINVDHYWEVEPGALGEFHPASGRCGTRTLKLNGISELAAGGTAVDYVLWPEDLRPPTNSPNDSIIKPLRIFALGEVVPHDGELAGVTAKTNNNFSFRELCFAKFRFMQGDRVTPLEGQIDITPLEKVTKPFHVDVRTTCGTFAAERVRVKVTVGGTLYTFRYADGSWDWDKKCKAVTIHAPKAARDKDGVQKDATGEQYDISFECDYTANAALKNLKIEAEILSDFRDLAVASAAYDVTIIEATPLPQLGEPVPQPPPVPVSHVFAAMASLTGQTPEQAFGPVIDASDSDSITTRYRTTALFTGSADVPAYAVCDGTLAIQRDPANNDTVNLLLRPRVQPIAGFTPVRYFVYRGLKLQEFLKGTSETDAALMQKGSTASPVVADAFVDFVALNAGATEMPSTAFGYDPADPVSKPLDEIFFRTGGSQLPPVARGALLGHFFGGTHGIGFDVVIENGAYEPTVGYARAAHYEIDISADLPALMAGNPSALTAASTAADDDFALRVHKEEILNFLDPAAFYGLHMHKDGVIHAEGDGPYSGADVFTKVVSKFRTCNRLYIDVRSDNGNSLNFHGNYGTGDQIKVGDSNASPIARPYADNGWPIVTVDAVPVTTTDDFQRVEIELPVADNEKPVLYVEHGASTSSFFSGASLGTGGPWTLGLDFSYPNDLASGARRGVAWVLRLHYGRRAVATRTVPLPGTVLKTQKYTDNVFGPIDRVSHWSGSSDIKWTQTQANRYVDAAASLNWRQMMTCGLAQQGASRVLLYAMATARDSDDPTPFIPLRSVPEGASDQNSFFAEPGLFGGFALQPDEIDDGGPVRTLELRQGSTTGYSSLSALLLGLSKTEFEGLQALSAEGLDTSYGRTLLLDTGTPHTDPNGVAYTKYRVGVQGLKSADGTYGSEFPAANVFVYSTDGQLFASPEFAKAEPLPAHYARGFEESKGVQQWPAQQRVIDAVTATSVTLKNVDWRKEVVAGDSVKIGQSKDKGNDGKYTVSSVSLSGFDTVIVLSGANLKSAKPVGHVFTPPKNIEDRFIDLDQDTTSGTTMRGLVKAFKSSLSPSDDLNALLTKVKTASGILTRARKLCSIHQARADDYERCLYWARLHLGAELRDHPLCRGSATKSRAVMKQFEIVTRGYDVTWSGAGKRIVVTGFDPFQLSKKIDRSNPSAAVALALHGETITDGTKSAVVISAIFPVRYDDFDAGVVEQFMNRFLSGSDKADMIITISQNGDESYFDLERYAGRARGGFPDNENHSRPALSKVGDGSYKEFYETTLPAKEMVEGPFTGTSSQRIYYDQSYVSAGSQVGHPGSINSNVNDSSKPVGDVSAGSGGNYLSNEIFYRTAYLREKAGNTTKTGHFHIPSTEKSRIGIDEIINEVRELIGRGLKAL